MLFSSRRFFARLRKRSNFSMVLALVITQPGLQNLVASTSSTTLRHRWQLTAELIHVAVLIPKPGSSSSGMPCSCTSYTWNEEEATNTPRISEGLWSMA